MTNSENRFLSSFLSSHEPFTRKRIFYIATQLQIYIIKLQVFEITLIRYFFLLFVVFNFSFIHGSAAAYQMGTVQYFPIYLYTFSISVLKSYYSKIPQRGTFLLQIDKRNGVPNIKVFIKNVISRKFGFFMML